MASTHDKFNFLGRGPKKSTSHWPLGDSPSQAAARAAMVKAPPASIVIYGVVSNEPLRREEEFLSYFHKSRVLIGWRPGMNIAVDQLAITDLPYVEGGMSITRAKIKVQNNLMGIKPMRAHFSRVAPAGAIVIYGRQGCGKSRYAKQLLAHFKKSHIVDDWVPGTPIPQYAIALTSEPGIRGAIHIDSLRTVTHGGRK